MARTLVRGNTQIMPESISNNEIMYPADNGGEAIELAKIQYADDIVRVGAPVSGEINMDGNKITGVAPATQGTDVVIKSQLDSISAGLDPKESVRVATTGNITLTDLQTIDGISLQAGDRVLVKNQIDPAENGIYTVVDSGNWVRSEDADGSTGEVSGGMFTFVEAGSSNAGTGWVVVADGTLVPDTDDINFTQFAGGGAIIGGLGINVSGTTVTADVDGITLINDGGGTSDKIAVAAGGIGPIQLATDAVTRNKILDDEVTASKINVDVAGSGLTQAASGALQVSVDGSSIIINGNTLEVDPSAIASDLAGDGLTSVGGDLDVNVDGTTIQITGGALTVNTTGITGVLAGDGLIADGDEIDVNVDDTTIEINADVLRVKAGGITATEINSSALGSGLTGGSGTAIAVDPSVVLTAANYVVRETFVPTNNQTDFQLANTQVAGTEMVFVNGILMEAGAGNDYTITSGGLISFEDGLRNIGGKVDKLAVTYFKQ